MGFQLLSFSVTDKQGDGTMGRAPLSPRDCLVVKATAGAADDKRRVSIIWKEGPFWKLVQRERQRQTVGVM